MKKRYTIYFHKTLCGTVDIAANSLEEAEKAAEDAFNNHELDVKFDEVDGAGVDWLQPDDEGSDHPEWADYEVNEDGELVEVE